MLKTLQQRNTMVKIVLAVVLGLICIAMVITLVPGPVGSVGNSPDAVANVGGQEITVAEVRRALDRRTSGQTLPRILQGLMMRQIIDQMILNRSLELEAKRLGIRVTPEEQAERIKQLLPMVFNGDTWIGKERYAAEVLQRTGLSVPEFEDWIRQTLLEEKFRELVTDGIRVTPDEVEQEFRRQNEKIQIEYVLLRPQALASGITPTEAELSTYFARNQLRYAVPERRSARYALLDFNQLRERAKISEEEVRAYYNQHIDLYKVQDRVHVEHILLKTVGKTDAEIAEIRKKAEDLLKKAKHGANFEDLAKQFSEDDATKSKGGDLGWIVHGQTVPEFERAAFSLTKGAVSDLVKTEYGFHIIKVLDRESARTKSLDEVRLSLLSALSDEKVQALSNELSAKMAAAVRQSNRQPLDNLARKFGLQVGETPPAGVKDPVGDLGNSPELHSVLFELHPGELSAPMRLGRGYAILTVKDILPAHPGTLSEVRDNVLADCRREESAELAGSRAEEVARRAKSGEPLAQVAKALGLEVKMSDPFSRTGSVNGVGSGRQLEAAFQIPVGQTSGAVEIGGNWLVYRVEGRQEAKHEDLAKQSREIERQLLDRKRAAAFEAFTKALEDRLRREGKMATNADVIKRLTNPS